MAARQSRGLAVAGALLLSTLASAFHTPIRPRLPRTPLQVGAAAPPFASPLSPKRSGPPHGTRTRMDASIPASALRVDWDRPDCAGGFGAVYFGEMDGEKIVVKVSFKDEFSERLLANEAFFNDKLMSSIPKRHGRRWAHFLGECTIPHSTKFPEQVSSERALVFKREPGLTLDTYLTGTTRAFASALHVRNDGATVRVELFKKVLGELLCSVVQLHRAGIMHRDIKPENILLSSNDRICPVKLIDLGSGCDMGSPSHRGLKDETIDVIYAPPELRVDPKHPDRYDVFCAAVTSLRVLMPSLGKDIEAIQRFRSTELPDQNFDLEGWLLQAAKGDGDAAREAFELLHPRHANIVSLLQGMLQKDLHSRTSPEAALRSLGPVWAARLTSVETLNDAMTRPLSGTLSRSRSVSLEREWVGRMLRLLATEPLWALVGALSGIIGKFLPHLLRASVGKAVKTLTRKVWSS